MQVTCPRYLNSTFVNLHWPIKANIQRENIYDLDKLELIVTVSTCTHGNDGCRPVRWNPLHSLQLQIRTRQRRDVQVRYSGCNYRRPSFELRPRPLPILRAPSHLANFY